MLYCWNIGNKSRIIPLCDYFTSPFNLLSVMIAVCASGPHVDYPFWKQCYKSVLSGKKNWVIYFYFVYMCLPTCVHVYHMCSVCEGLKKVMDHLEPRVADSSEPPCGSWNRTQVQGKSYNCAIAPATSFTFANSSPCTEGNILQICVGLAARCDLFNHQETNWTRTAQSLFRCAVLIHSSLTNCHWLTSLLFSSLQW